jgi:ubiquinone/menaquinone biosynthesis C-methylase UbiE
MMINKLENKIRLDELKPEETLKKIGFKDNMILCDFGAGTGVFSFAASKISSGNIYAIDISDGMIELLNNRVENYKVKNVLPIKVNSDVLPLENESCDMILMATVLHEIENKEEIIKEFIRILKNDGKLAIIEFHKKVTPMGPPVDHRISENDVDDLLSNNSFKMLDKISLGSNFYLNLYGLSNK